MQTSFSCIHSHLFVSLLRMSYNSYFSLKDAGLQTCPPNLSATRPRTFLQCQNEIQRTSIQRRKSAFSSWCPMINFCICTHLCRHLRKGVWSCQDVPLLAQGTAALPSQPSLCGQNCRLAQIPPSDYTIRWFFLQGWKNLPMQCPWDNLAYCRSPGENVKGYCVCFVICASAENGIWQSWIHA